MKTILKALASSTCGLIMGIYMGLFSYVVRADILISLGFMLLGCITSIVSFGVGTFFDFIFSNAKRILISLLFSFFFILFVVLEASYIPSFQNDAGIAFYLILLISSLISFWLGSYLFSPHN